MKAADLLFLGLIAVLLSVDHFVLWPAFLRRSQANPGCARRWLWSAWMMLLWTLAAGGIALWLFEARSWEPLGFVFPSGWRRWIATSLVLALVLHFARIVIRIAQRKRPTRVKMGNADVERLAPHTRAELAWWVALSLSAGFCEEFIFRGYLLWAFQPIIGLAGAAVLSVVGFAAAHAYQGANRAMATGVVAAVFTAVVLLLGSLWPAIALHALTDIGHGVVAWLALRKVGNEDDASARLANPSGGLIVGK